MPYKDPKNETRRSQKYREARREATGTNAPLPRQFKKLRGFGEKPWLKIAVIPDAQVKPNVPIDHLLWCGDYLADKQPDVILCIGDFADLISLSTYDEKGSLIMEGTRYRKDIDSVKLAMDVFCEPIAKVNSYSPRKIMLLGNHEDRITRAVNKDPKLEGLISLDDLPYASHGWEVYPFLQPVSINDVVFCHYFPGGIMGHPINTARGLLAKLHMSAYAGHLQGRDIAYGHRADGSDMTAIISGSFYQHQEKYLSPFTNNHWRGMYMLHEVKQGMFDEMAVSIPYLKRRFIKKGTKI